MRRFFACSSGGVAVSTAFLLTMLIGLTGLAAEASLWFQTKRSMQGAADAAAVSAARALTAGTGSCVSGSACSWTPGLNGLSVAAEDGWKNSGTNGVQVTVVSPPTKSGSPFYGNANAVEVWITQTQTIMLGSALNVSAPKIGAYAIAVSTTTQTEGADCVLALANDPAAVTVTGVGDLSANCGIAIDGGKDQNVSGTPQGGISFNGSKAKVNITNLVVASISTNCPSASHCFLYNSSSVLPASSVITSTATVDPYASMVFPTPPLGVQSATVSAQGSGYTNGTRTFTVTGGTGTAAKITATVSGGKVTAITGISDPGAYTAMPTSPATATPDTGGGSGAKFTLTEGCFTWAGTAIPGRKYCSINLNGSGTTNFPAGSYYIAGGDGGCQGFCVSSAQATVTSDNAGVTFYLTHGEGSGTYGTSSYATIGVTSGTITLCAPGTSCGTGCSGTCVLFFQDRAAPASTSNGAPSSTNNTFAGNGQRTFSGLIYMPEQTITMQGTSGISGCTGLVAKYVSVGGTPSFTNGCLPGNGIGGGTITTTSLSE
ncbi:hypothetical protein GCM10011611_20090 [Aliidongia dinghuensis]|uniref:Putative Flp pilus-assembly TadG-like N-terminal domain-containing protein n=1 Tax=Aliidongia dinghuensis TaxID=1867774 RepID=A0A8J3E386_9PROT|nr:pilus assembly protein TadG-related protein [Aliidongia dinghuensis]GGF14303.1 hypothetical protein GCM10011611_20090 [Aliidongia dinghuensis]